MKTTILSPSEYVATTTTCDPTRVYTSSESCTAQATSSGDVVIAVARFLPEGKARDGMVQIDDLIAELEVGGEGKAAFAEARRWVADSFYSETNSLRALRLAKGLSQRELADKIGTKQPHIARIESGQDVQISTVVKLADALGVSGAYLYRILTVGMKHHD